MSEQSRIDEAAALGVEFCGFVFHEPSPRNVTPLKASLLDTHGMKRVGVFVHQSVEEIRAVVRQAGLDCVQLHGGQSAEFAGAFPAKSVVRVLWPARYASRDALERDIEAFAGTCGIVSAGCGHGQRPGTGLAFSARAFVPSPVVSFRRTFAAERGTGAEGLFARRAGLQFETGIFPGCEERGENGGSRGRGSRMGVLSGAERRRRDKRKKR